MTEEQSRIKNESEFQDARVEKGGVSRAFHHLIREEHEFLFESMGSVEKKKILIMGCSTGGVTPLARRGGQVLGIDISLMSIQQLSKSIDEEKLSSNASIALMDCENLGLKKESFDMVLFIGVLHHLDIEQAMAESFRVLKSGGRVFMAEPLGLHPLVNMYRLLTPKLRTQYEHPLKPGDFKIMRQYFNISLMKGFCLTSVMALLPYYLLKNEKIYEITRRILIKTDDLLFKYMPFLKYFAWSSVTVLTKDE